MLKHFSKAGTSLLFHCDEESQDQILARNLVFENEGIGLGDWTVLWFEELLPIRCLGVWNPGVCSSLRIIVNKIWGFYVRYFGGFLIIIFFIYFCGNTSNRVFLEFLVSCH
jgi:hypothetical protein